MTLSGTEQASNPMGLIRIDDLKIRLQPSSAKFTIVRFDGHAWKELSIKLVVDKGDKVVSTKS